MKYHIINGIYFVKVGKGQYIRADKYWRYKSKKAHRYGKLLSDGYNYDNPVWGALKKAWRAYKIALAKGEEENLRKYAKIIMKIQKSLGLPMDDFTHVGVTVTDMYMDKEINDYY